MTHQTTPKRDITPYRRLLEALERKDKPISNWAFDRVGKDDLKKLCVLKSLSVAGKLKRDYINALRAWVRPGP